jgi:hypothetical protein
LSDINMSVPVPGSYTVEPTGPTGPTGSSGPGGPNRDDGTVTVRAPQGISLQREANPNTPPEYPSKETLVEWGSEHTLDNLRRQIAWLTSSYRGSADWRRVAQYVRKETIIAMAMMSEEVGIGEDPPSALSQLAVELAVVARATVWTGGMSNNVPLGDGTGSVYSLPFLRVTGSGGPSVNHTISDFLREALATAAIRWGGPWLAFATEEVLKGIAEEDGGGLLGEMAELVRRTSLVTFETKMSSNQLNILQAFFKDA